MNASLSHHDATPILIHTTPHAPHTPATQSVMADVGDIEAYLEAQVEQQVGLFVVVVLEGKKGRGG